jgi:hypothetical protein
MPSTPEPASSPEPSADRPRLPAVYGAPSSTEGILPWDRVERRLAEAPIYWIATTGRDARPRVRPVSGLYLRGTLYVSGSRESGWARDLESNSHVAVHLEDGHDVVIVEGEGELLTTGVEADVAERLAAISNAKYPESTVTAETFAGPGPYAIRPRRVFAWTQFPADVTRFRFPLV